MFVRSSARQRLCVSLDDDIQKGRLIAWWYEPTHDADNSAPGSSSRATVTTTAFGMVNGLDWSGLVFPGTYVFTWPSGFQSIQWTPNDNRFRQKATTLPTSAIAPAGPFGVPDINASNDDDLAGQAMHFLMPELSRHNEGVPPLVYDGGFYSHWGWEPNVVSLQNFPGWSDGNWSGNAVRVVRGRFRTVRPHVGFLVEMEVWAPNYDAFPAPWYGQFRHLTYRGPIVLGAQQFYEVPLPGGTYAGGVWRGSPGASDRGFAGRAVMANVSETRDQFTARTGLVVTG